MSLRDPLVALRQMRDHAREAINLVAGKSRADLDGSRILSLAIVRLGHAPTSSSAIKNRRISHSSSCLIVAHRAEGAKPKRSRVPALIGQRTRER
jgi:hypothetical protein